MLEMLEMVERSGCGGGEVDGGEGLSTRFLKAKQQAKRQRETEEPNKKAGKFIYYYIICII